MRIVRFVSFMLTLPLIVVIFNFPNNGLLADGSLVRGFQSREQRLATVLPIILAAVGIVLPFRGKWELPRILVAVLGASAVTGTLTRPHGFEYVVHVGMWEWIGIVLWFIWTINDRAISDPAISDWLVKWFSLRRMAILVAFLLFVAGVLMVMWDDQAFGGVALASAPFPMEIPWEREWALFLPFALVMGGLVAARGGRNQAFLALSALFVALVALGTAYLSWGDIHVNLLLSRRLSTSEWVPVSYRLLPLWTFLPLWLMLWAIDWIESLLSGRVNLPRANEPEAQRPAEASATEG